MRTLITTLFALLIAAWLWFDARAQTNAPLVKGAHRFEKIVDGIYYATASGTMIVGANSPVIVNDTEAIVIDSETSPAAGRALVEDIKVFSDKPVKYVIDTHYHFDHLFGNQIFGPDVQVIGHDHTRVRLQTNTLQQFTFLNSVNPMRVETLRQRIASEKDAQQKATLEQQLQNTLAYFEQVKEVKQTPPNIDLRDHDDAVPRRARAAPDVSGSRPHRHRRRHVPAQRAHRCDWRSDGVRPLVFG